MKVLGFITSLISASPHQLPFATPPQPQSQQPLVRPTHHSDSNSRSFTLQRAVHLSLTDRLQPIFHRTYSDEDRLHATTSLTPPGKPMTALSIKTTKATAWKPNNQKAFQAARRSRFFTPRALMAGRALSMRELEDEIWGSTLEWEESEIDVPDVSDVPTLNALGKLTANAYILSDEAGWYDVDGRWNVTDSFGWAEDGVRGHVFADETNSTIIVAIKGTSGAVAGGAPTGKNDKTNDNLLFSCCCARVDWSWRTVCDCYAGGYTCQQNCVEEAVMTKSAYYPVVTDLFNNITALYPHADIWLTGHSLGGALTSLLSLTYGVPSVSFEAPADHLAAKRLHLPTPPGLSYSDSQITTQVRHTADPIAMGTCTGVTSSCAIAGFAMESKCHSGRNIVYDTVGVLGWSVDIRTHGIITVIENVLIEDWGVSKKVRDKKPPVETQAGIWGWWPGGGGKKEPEEGDEDSPNKDDPQHGGRGVPDWQTEEECVDCFKWEYQ